MYWLMTVYFRARFKKSSVLLSSQRKCAVHYEIGTDYTSIEKHALDSFKLSTLATYQAIKKPFTFPSIIKFALLNSFIIEKPALVTNNKME